MFQTGDRVVYGSHGVCDIIGTEEQEVDRKRRVYLVLEPLGQPGSRYLVPTHNPAAMGKLKAMLTREELAVLIQSESVRQNCWVLEENQRKQVYRELISSTDREKVMSMMYTLYLHKAEQAITGRKLHLCDENFLRDAEKLLAGEISIVLGLNTNDALKYIRFHLKE